MEREGDVGYAPQENSFISIFKALPEKSATTIRFFERSGSNDSCFYTVYGKDAHFTANEFFKTAGALKSFGGTGNNKLEYVNLSRTGFENFVRDLLLVKQYKVEVFTNFKSKGWKCDYKGSPGNLAQFEDLLFNSSEVTVNNGVVGVKLSMTNGVRLVGVAHVNTNECIINLLEFEDCDGFTNLESVLVQLSPKEAVISGSSSQADELQGIRQVLNRNRILINERPNSEFDAKNIIQDMTRLLKSKPGELGNFAVHPDVEKRSALSAAAAVIKYLELISHESCFGEFSLQPFDFRLYVKMDSAACRALHVGGVGDDEMAKAGMTVTAVIDKCRTAQGHRLLAQFLKQPLLDKDKLEERLDLVQIFVEDVILRQSLYEDHLRRIPDCQVLARKFMKKKLHLPDCYKAYLCASKLHRIVELLEQYDGAKKSVLMSLIADPLKSLVEELTNYCELIEKTLDLDMADRGEFVVKPEFDEGLAELRNEMNVIEEKMSEESYRVAKSVGLEVNKTLKLESNNQHGYYFRITLKEETAIRNVAGLTILDSNKAGVRFRNSDLEYLSQKYGKKHQAYLTKQKDFVKEMLEVAAGYYRSFEQLGNVTSFLDVMISFAVAAVGNAEVYVRPTLLPRGTGRIKFENLRHPCVETQKGVSFIPNDVNFEKGKESFYIVTGPNMGGKSTFLRSIGVATLLAHIGSFVPASVAEISMVDAILARVGAGDNLTKGVSTFMAEMIETSFILKTATTDSMVLIDELGRGTSTYDGFGLCWAISEHLSSKVDCFCVLATHFHELTELANQVPTVKNLHVTAIAEESGLQMLYKIGKGSCDRSFGLHVAKITEFPEQVLQEARSMALKLEDFCSENDLDDTAEGVKRRQDDKKAGMEIIDQVLQQVKSLAQSCKTEGAYKKEIESVLKNFQGLDNRYIQHILSTLDAN